jgi:hypothetical protein
MKPIKFNPNDPKLWTDFDPTERAEEFVDGKSQIQIERIRLNKRITETVEWKEANTKGLDKRRQLYNLSEQQKKSAEKRYKFPGGEEKRIKFLEKAKITMSYHPKIVEARNKIHEEQSKEIVTPFGNFISYNEANRNIPVDLAKKLKSHPHLYYFKEHGPGEITYEDVYNTPYGKSNKRSDVYTFCKSNNEYWTTKTTHNAHWWKKVSTLNSSEYFISNEPKFEWSTIGILRNVNKRT